MTRTTQRRLHEATKSRRTIDNRTLIGLLAGLGVTLAFSGTAGAVAPSVVELSPGIGGPESDNGGPGNEQPTVATIEKNGKLYVVAVYMNSNVDEKDAPYQGKCSSILLSPNDSPQIVADQVQISHYQGGDRLFNHPKIASDGTHVVYTFGSDGNVDGNDNGNVATYAGVLDEMCKVVAKPVRVSTNGGNNEGAPDIQYAGNGYFSAGYLSQGGNDTSRAYGLMLATDAGQVSLKKTYQKDVVSPANIGRPTIVAAGGGRTLFCAAKGDQRPPEDGVECAWLDAKDGTVMWKQIIAKSEPDKKIYMNQPTVAAMGNGRFAVQVIQSSGEGKNKNKKGSSLTRLYVIEPTDDGPQMKADLHGVGPYQSHTGLCSGRYGTDGAIHLGVFDASPTGVGEPGMQMVRYDSVAKQITADTNLDQWVVGYYGDSGYLANLYGQNPHKQGRDFLRCIADVPNPGHGVTGGYLPQVKSFFVAPHAGRRPGEPKNALFVTFIPGEVDTPQTPEPPHEENGDTSGATTGGGPTGATTGGATTGGATTGGTSGAGGATPSGNGDDTSNGLPPGTTAPNGCACSVPGGSSSSPAGALALLGLAVAAFARSRKEG